jgi:hypothetical protein
VCVCVCVSGVWDWKLSDINSHLCSEKPFHILVYFEWPEDDCDGQNVEKSAYQQSNLSYLDGSINNF